MRTLRLDGLRWWVGLVLWCATAVVHAASVGMIGYSGKDPRHDCSSCHRGAVDNTRITLKGPSAVTGGTTVVYTLELHGAPGTAGGINVAVTAGALRAAGSDTRVVLGELTHRATGLTDNKGTLQYQFQWQAPHTPGAVTFFVAGVLGNSDRNPGNDGALRTRVQVNVTARGARAASERAVALRQRVFGFVNIAANLR